MPPSQEVQQTLRAPAQSVQLTVRPYGYYEQYSSTVPPHGPPGQEVRQGDQASHLDQRTVESELGRLAIQHPVFSSPDLTHAASPESVD